MTDFYLRQGEYGAGVGQGYITGGTLTITSLTSGHFNIGGTISGGSITPGTVISALGTGTGGAGTYTIQQPSNQTVGSAGSPITITVNGSLPLSTPLTTEWGVAQDGDGRASGLALPATAFISFSNIPTTGTSISVFGISVSTTNVLNAASADAAANALATNINTTAGTSYVAAVVAEGQPTLQNFVYARGPSAGAPTGTCQVMTRAGSTTCNYVVSTNTSPAILTDLNNVSSTTANQQFSGGASGAWGWLVNPMGAIWPGAVAAWTYGVGYIAARVRPHCGPLLTISDWLHCRGNDSFISASSGSSIGVTFTSQLNLLVDDGTVFSGATGAFTFKSIMQTGGSSYAINIGVASTPPRPCHLAARTPKKLVFDVSHQSGNSGTFALGTNSSNTALVVTNALMIEQPISTSARFDIANPGNHSMMFDNCWFKWTNNVWHALMQGSIKNQGALLTLEFYGCTFEWTAYSGASDGIVQIEGLSTTDVYKFEDCTAIGATPRPFRYQNAPSWNLLSLYCKNLKGFDLPSALLGYLGQNAQAFEYLAGATFLNVGIKRATRIETTQFVVDWIPTAATAYPTLDQTLDDGTLWSWRMLLSYLENAIRYHRGNEVLSLLQRYEDTDESNTKQLTVELLVPGGVAASLYASHFGVRFAYTDNTGTVRFEQANWYLRPLEDSTAMTASSASWNLNGYTGHVARKITLTTTYPLKHNQCVEATIFQRRPMPGGANQEIFVNPAIGIA